jgi:hypothetical protein
MESLDENIRNNMERKSKATTRTATSNKRKAINNPPAPKPTKRSKRNSVTSQAPVTQEPVSSIRKIKLAISTKIQR